MRYFSVSNKPFDLTTYQRGICHSSETPSTTTTIYFPVYQSVQTKKIMIFESDELYGIKSVDMLELRQVDDSYFLDLLHVQQTPRC